VRQGEERYDHRLDELPTPDVIAGMYCASDVGKSKCNDLDSMLSCQRFSCPVYEQYGLSDGDFCIRGAAGWLGARAVLRRSSRHRSRPLPHIRHSAWK
jgi:hypothetical protein